MRIWWCHAAGELDNWLGYHAADAPGAAVEHARRRGYRLARVVVRDDYARDTAWVVELGSDGAWRVEEVLP